MNPTADEWRVWVGDIMATTRLHFFQCVPWVGVSINKEKHRISDSTGFLGSVEESCDNDVIQGCFQQFHSTMCWVISTEIHHRKTNFNSEVRLENILGVGTVGLSIGLDV